MQEQDHVYLLRRAAHSLRWGRMPSDKVLDQAAVYIEELEQKLSESNQDDKEKIT